jgi:cyanophycinase
MEGPTAVGRVGSGPVALLGSNEFEPWTDPLDRVLLETADGDGTVAILPTASAPEGEVYAEWAQKGLDHYARLGVPARVVELRGRDDADSADLARQVERASLVFFSGGNPAYLARVLGGSRVWASIETAVRRGAAYVGCSAGACVAGEYAPDSMTEHVWEDRWVSGLRLLPGAWVIPHFDALDSHRQGLRDFFVSRVPPAGWAMGIDDRTALARVGQAWHVFGDGGVFLRCGDVAFRASGGDTFRLDASVLADRGVDPSVVLVLDPIPAGAGPIGLLSSEQFSEGSREADSALLERAGPRVGVVLVADPSNAERVAGEAMNHYTALGARPRIVDLADDLSEVDLVFLAGGDPSRLLASARDRASWEGVVARWRAGMGLAGSSAGAMVLSTNCLLPEEGADEPTNWGRGLGPLRSFGLAVHAASRPEAWLAGILASAPVPVVALDDAAGLVMTSAEPPLAVGEGRIRRFDPDAPEEPEETLPGGATRASGVPA